jgi:putative protease
MPWQIAFFKQPQKLQLWIGPFCNIANRLAIEQLAAWQVRGVIVSPELDKSSFLELGQSNVLPLGIVISANWPLCLSRVKARALNVDQPFRSPKNEEAWVRQHGPNYWVYPNWRLDLSQHKRQLIKAGYRHLFHLPEIPPKTLKMKKRPGLWNWELQLS